MLFPEFIQKLSSVLRAGDNTSKFTKSILEDIVTEDALEILGEYADSSYKAFYNGNTSINKIALKINRYVDPMNFSNFLHGYGDATIESLCDVYKDELPEIDAYNAHDQIAGLFSKIITEAAGTNKKSAPKSAKPEQGIKVPAINLRDVDIPCTIVPFSCKVTFDDYVEKATNYYSQKKTLLYAEQPRPFYDIFVCNDLKKHVMRNFLVQTKKGDIITLPAISNVTVQTLESDSPYILIEGIGGIGKSMFLTHLFLSSAKVYLTTGKVPVFLSLKDYKENISNLTEFILSAVNAFDSSISQDFILEKLKKRQMILLLDGLDEVTSSARLSFDRNLESFIKYNPGNTIIITSRPIDSFVSYTMFTVYDIEPLTKEQALSLIGKLKFWDADAKQKFMQALNDRLFSTHYEFASNPLLLTIMLMTYSYYGDIPAKMHVFYSQAYETMARLHDATKGAYIRPFHTNLTPEEFKKPFSEFCARSYAAEVFEFTWPLFSNYMESVLKNTTSENKIAVRDFLLDLTDNLCIMYHEGDKCYFIHRSFQEYFAAFYFSNVFDARLQRVGEFFETARNRAYYDRTFEMLYDMDSERIERFIFLPFLRKKFDEWNDSDPNEMYWNFLEDQYPTIYYECGTTPIEVSNSPQSFLYRFIIREKKIFFANYLLSAQTKIHVNEHIADFPTHLYLTNSEWPAELLDMPKQEWVSAYTTFTEATSFSKYPNPKKIPKSLLKKMTLIDKKSVPDRYVKYFDEPRVEGYRIKIEISKIRKKAKKFATLRNFMSTDDFPFMLEYLSLKKYYFNLLSRVRKEENSGGLFDN